MATTEAERRIHTYCSLCVACCGAIAVVRDNRFTDLEPDPSHPTGQALCAKGRAAPELVYHGQRLTHPLRRTRPKGDPDPGWERISWDEALDLTASAMRRTSEQYGPASVAFTVSSPSTTSISDSNRFIRRLANIFGTPNAGITLDLCGWGRGFATRYTYGMGSLGIDGDGAMPDIEKSGTLILWGYNPSHTRLPHATAVIAALKRGMRLIVIDPRHVGLAAKADLWLRVRPGTDGALALGIANVLIERQWYDRDFIRDWSNGPHLVRADNGRFLTARDVAANGDPSLLLAWDAMTERLVSYDPATGRYECESSSLALEGEYRIAGLDGWLVCYPSFELYKRLCGTYRPARVAAICWVSATQIAEAARLIWMDRPTSYYAWSGHEQHANVTQTARAMSLLYALTGCFDRPGGNVLFPRPPVASITGEDLFEKKQNAATLGLADRPLGPARWGYVAARDLYRAVTDGVPYRVHAIIGFGANMLLAHSDGVRGRAALKELDFYAHADLFMNPTAELADVILPVASAFEREGLKLGFEVSASAQALIQLRPAIVDPPGEARSDTQIVFDLAARLGLGEHFWGGDVDAAYSHQLGPTGVTLRQLRASPGGVQVTSPRKQPHYAEPGADGVCHGFATPSRKVEVYSQTFLDHGYAPLPEFLEPQVGPAARPDLAASFPLVMTSAKPMLFCQSQHRALPSLRSRAADPEVEIHPETAIRRCIANGDWVTIETPDGRARARARFNNNLDPRVVVGFHGWWQACNATGGQGYDAFDSAGANFNLLVGGTALDPVSGTPSHRGYLCEIRPAI